MLTLAEIRLLLQDRKIGIVAQATGVERHTIARVRKGHGCNVSTLEKLSNYFEKEKK